MNMPLVLLNRRRRGGPAAFSPSALFALAEPGVWYDPSDLTTLFQDTAGTQPVTTPGQTVALALDKSKGLVLGSELVTNGTFDSGVTSWTGINATLSQSSGACVITADGSGQARASQTISTVAGRWYEARATLARGTGTVNVDLLITGITNSASVSSTTPTDVVVRFAATGATVTIRAGSNGTTAAGTTYIVDNISVKELPGFHATQATLASRPTYQVDGSGKAYLSFDGVDDFMVTRAIDFTGTDAMTVWAGVRKNSDTARGTVVELTASAAANNGAFHLTAPNAASATYAFESKGTTLTDAVATGVTAPITSVLCGYSDISLDQNILRVNGVQADSDTGDQGTGNFSNAIVYIGRRAGTSLPANMRLYSIIVRGAATDVTTIGQGETWVNGKTGAYT